MCKINPGPSFATIFHVDLGCKSVAVAAASSSCPYKICASNLVRISQTTKTMRNTFCKVLLKDYSSTHRKIQIKQCFMHEDFSIFYQSHGVCSYFYICILFTDHHSCENARYSPFVPVKMAHRHFCITVIRRINRIVPLINFSPPFFKSCILIYKLRTWAITGE